MQAFGIRPSRRRQANLLRLVLVAVLAAVFCWPGAATSAVTGYDDLDNPSIMVKNPAMTPLVAITLAGQRLVAVGLHGVIVYSTDSGKSWQQAAAPVDVTLTAVYFDSAQHGYAVGHFGVIMTTRDSGLTWTRAVDGLDVINALNSDSRRAQSSNPASPDSQFKLRVATAYQRVGPSKPFLAVGRCGNGVLAAGQQDMAMYSSDFGKTWQTWIWSINNPTFRNIYAVFSNNLTSWLIGEDGLVYKSAANCQNFSPVSGPYVTTLFGGFAANAKKTVLYGINGGAYVSNDAGGSWKQATLGTESVIGAGAAMASGKILLGSLDGNLYLSDEDGETFHQIAATVPYQIAGLVAAPDGNVVIVGNGGVDVIPAAKLQ